MHMPVAHAAVDVGSQLIIIAGLDHAHWVPVVGPPTEQSIISAAELAEQEPDLLISFAAIDLESVEILCVHGPVDKGHATAAGQATAGNGHEKSTCDA